MMKIFFILPPNIHYIEPYAFTKADQNNSLRPNLGLLYVAANLRKELGITVKFIDASAEQLSLKQIEKIIETEKPDMVGFSVLTFNLLNCLEVASIIRRASPDTRICFGGWHPTIYPKETLAFKEVDYIICGEGEFSFPELVALLAKNNKYPDEKKLNAIAGIGYKSTKGSPVITEQRSINQNLDDLPFPAYDLVDHTKYSNLLACTNTLANIVTSRGCPHICSFCDMRRTAYRFRSAKNVVEEIKSLANNGVKEFFIQDDNFSINKKRSIDFCKQLIDAQLNIKYKISSRVDYIDDEIAYYLKKSGCYRIYFGVESGSQKVLDYLQKGISIQQIEDAFKITKKHGIDAFAYIIIGTPIETNEDLKKTVRLIKKIKPHHLHCSICTPMPKTFLYEELLKNKLIQTDYWKNFAINPDPNFKTPFASQCYSDRALRKKQNSIQRRFYLNPKIMLLEAIRTKSLAQLLRKSKMAFKIICN